MAKRPTRLTDEEMQAIARALADPRRFAILQQIARCDGTRCSSLEQHEVLSPATVSHHLKELCDAGLIDITREGRTACLTLRRPTWDAYVAQLGKL